MVVSVERRRIVAEGECGLGLSECGGGGGQEAGLAHAAGVGEAAVGVAVDERGDLELVGAAEEVVVEAAALAGKDVVEARAERAGRRQVAEAGEPCGGVG